MSGKGGVGKSLVTALIALGLRRRHLRVGILDADITGPSIPKLFGLRTPLTIEADPDAKTPQGHPQPLMYRPSRVSAIEVVSSNLLTDKEDTAMIWRGPIVTGVIRQFFEQVLWSDLDVLLDRPAARNVRRAAHRAAVAVDRRRRAGDDAASAGDDDRAQSGEPRPTN